MRKVITVVRRHGASRWQLALDATRDQKEHRRFLKSLRMTKDKQHPDYEEAMMCIPVSVVKLKPKEEKASAAKPSASFGSQVADAVGTLAARMGLGVKAKA